MRRGSQPRGGGPLVNDMPVVWLTDQRTRREFSDGWMVDCRKRGWQGPSTWLHDSPLRLVISEPDVPVFRWIEWVSDTPLHNSLDRWFTRRYLTKWWVAFAPISPNCISVG